MRNRIEEFLRRLFRRPPPIPPYLAARRPCCQKEENLVRSNYGPDKMMDMCKVCGARHFRFKAEPGKMGTKGMPIGKR